MANVYLVYEDYGNERYSVACSYSRQEADRLAKEINDEYQAVVAYTEEYALYDNYGFPVTAAEYAEINGRI